MGINNPVSLICFIIITLEAIIGISMNFFIIFLICFWYFKGQSVSASNKIIMALSIANVSYTFISFTNILIFIFFPELFLTTHIGPSIFVFNMFIITSSSWLTACLCFFYFMKIKMFSSLFLSWLKTKISSAVPWMILLAEVVSLFSASLNILQFVENEDSSKNISLILLAKSSSNRIFPNNLYISFISSCLPFVISVVTIASTVWSLNLHSRRVEQNKTSASGSVNVKAYEGTIRIMICLLIFYVLIYAILFLFYFNIFVAYSPEFWVFLIIIGSYAPTQSILLTLANTKLKEAWMKIFNCSTLSTQQAESKEE